MDDPNSTRVDDFSLIRSGMFYRLLVWLKLAGPTSRDYLIRILAICGTIWVPLLALTLLQGVAFGSKVEIPFVGDFANHVRFLLIIPILIFGERSVDLRLNELSNFFFKAGILNQGDIYKWNRIQKSMKRLSESLVADSVILLIIALNLSIRWLVRTHASSYWPLIPEGDHETLSWAGMWYLSISMPVFQYLWLRWTWRWILWFLYFTKIAGLPLKLNAAHPDRAGGLGFLGIPPGPF